MPHATDQENWEDRMPLHGAAYSLRVFDDPDYRTSVVRTGPTAPKTGTLVSPPSTSTPTGCA